MAKPTIHKYGYDDGKRGLEAAYWVDDDTLYVKIFGSNHWRDYAACLLAWPRKRIPHGKVHRAWANMAVSLAVDIMMVLEELPDNVHIIGHSMGGAVGAILPAMLRYKKCAVQTINAPKPGNRKYMKWLSNRCILTAYYDKGDIIRFFPLMYRRYANRSEYDNTRPFWKAHNNLIARFYIFPTGGLT